MSDEIKVRITLDKSAALAETDAFRADQRQALKGIQADAESTEKGIVAAAKRTAAAKGEILRDSSGRFAAAFRAEGRAAKESAVQATEAFREMGSSGKSGFLGASVGAHALVAVMREVIEAGKEAIKVLDQVDDKQRKRASKTNDTRENMAELAQLLGEKPDNKFVEKQARFAVRAGGLSLDETTRARTAFANSGQQHVGTKEGQISKEQAEQLSAKGSKLALSYGVDPEVVNDMLGRQLGEKDYSKEKDPVAAALGDVNAQLATGASGSGSLSQVGREKTKLAATGIMGSQESMKWVSVMSEGMNEGQSEATQAAIKAARGFDKEKGGQSLREAGVTAEDAPELAVKKIGEWAERKAAAGPKGTTASDVLRAGFDDELGSRALGVAYTKGVKGGAFAARDETAAAAGTAEATEGQLKGYDVSERGIDRQRKAEGELQQTLKGIRGSKLATLRQEGANLGVETGQLEGSSNEMKAFFADKMTFGALGTMDKEKVDTMSHSILLSRMTPELKKKYKDVNLLSYRSPEAREGIFNEMMDAIEKTGNSALTDEELPPDVARAQMELPNGMNLAPNPPKKKPIPAAAAPMARRTPEFEGAGGFGNSAAEYGELVQLFKEVVETNQRIADAVEKKGPAPDRDYAFPPLVRPGPRPLVEPPHTQRR